MLDINFSISSNSWLKKEIKINSMGYVLIIVFCLKDWKMFVQKKSYSVLLQIGPVVVRISNLDKLNKFIKKTLKEHEDKFHSEM